MAAASGDAHPWPIYNARYRVVFPVFDADGDLVTAMSTPDSEVSQDQGTFADATNEATEIATGSGMYYLDLVAGEMDTKCTAVIVKSATSGMKTTPLILYPRRFPVLRTGTAQAGAATTITLDANASAVDDFYNGCYVNITNNSPANAQGQARRITDYVGSTKVATVEAAWGTNPSSASTFEILLTDDVGADMKMLAGAAVNDPVNSGIPNVRLADAVSHGGTLGSSTATLAMSRVNVASQTADTSAVTLLGNGTGEGLTSQGGATGNGAEFIGGATSGNGITSRAATSGVGIAATGVGTTQAGISATGGSTSSDGIRATGGGTGSGVRLIGGSGGGNGVHANATGANGAGLLATGFGSGAGFNVQGGATGNGVAVFGGATSGAAINASATSGNGMTLTAGTNGTGLSATGAGTGEGISAVGGATGNGIEATGGATSGSGIVGTAATSGSGMILTGAGGSADLDADITGNITGNLSGSVGSVTGAVGSVTGDVGGNVTGSVGSVAAGGITAASIATGAIDADALAADAVTEIWAGSTAPTAATIADAVWDEDATAHQTQGTFGQAIGDPAADTNSIFKAVVTDATGATVGVDVAAVLDDTGTSGVVLANDAITAAKLAADAGTEIGTAVWATATRSLTVLDEDSTTLDLDATIRAAVGLAAANLDTQIGTLPTAAENADAVWDEAQADHVGAGTFGVTASEIADILVDTAEIGAAGAGLTNINLPDQTMNITGNITGNLSGSVGSVTGLTVANLDVAVSTRLATAGYTAPDNASITSILADTNELQTDWADGGRLDLILDARAGQASVDDLPTNAELAAALDPLPTAAENATAVGNLTLTELAAIPGASPALKDALALLYMALRNQRETTATTDIITNDAGAAIATATLSDDTTTFTKSEYV